MLGDATCPFGLSLDLREQLDELGFVVDIVLEAPFDRLRIILYRDQGLIDLVRYGGGHGAQAAFLAESRKPSAQSGRDRLRLPASDIRIPKRALGLPESPAVQHENDNQCGLRQDYRQRSENLPVIAVPGRDFPESNLAVRG